MKKLKDKLRSARSFLSIRTYKSPMLFMIGMMIILNIIILCIAALIALSIDDSFTGFFDAFANGSLKWMLTPNAILQIENTDLLVLAATVLVIGMILFTGTIIALTTNALKEYFQKKKEGSGKIYLQDHIVILNWNNKVPELVADLVHVEDQEIKVIILAQIDKTYAEKQILNAINKNKHNDKELSNLNVLVKNGDPLLYSELSDISIEDANSLLIMNKDLHSTVIKGMSKSDLNVIKVILSVGRIQFKNDPPIVAEIKKIETKEKIITMSDVVKTLHEHKIMPICFDRRLGQIIAQTIICSKMEDVYLSLFSFDDSEIYHLESVDFDDCLNNYSHVIPTTRFGDDLFVLSLNDKIKDIKSAKEHTTRELKLKKINMANNLNVYVVGSNNKLNFIMESFNEYERLYKSEFKAIYVEEDKIKSIVKELNETDKPSTIVLLSDELQEQDSLDANVIDNLIYLQGHLKKKDVNIIVELLDPQNDHIIKDFDIENTIISNKIISLLLSKLALYKETAPFYENLLTMKSDVTGKDDQNIFIVKASDLLKEEFPLQFETVKDFLISLYKSSRKSYIPIGYFRDNKLRIFEGDMNLKEDIQIIDDDEIVLMKI
ncbi:MAG: hypothetical protein KAH13_03410 [Tenericutes bacterium]|nr:hypothetical protein [Mycoplasmatota bacterium]